MQFRFAWLRGSRVGFKIRSLVRNGGQDQSVPFLGSLNMETGGIICSVLSLLSCPLIILIVLKMLWQDYTLPSGFSKGYLLSFIASMRQFV